LNSDDKYNDNAVLKAVEVFKDQSNCLLLYGQGQHIDEYNNVLSTYPTLPLPVSIQDFKKSCFICQPTVFFQRSILILLGILDENLKTTFDFDYWLRVFLAFPTRIAFIDRIQAFSRLHKACITQKMRRTIALESMQILAHHLDEAPLHWILTYIEERLEQSNQNNVMKEVDSILNEISHYTSKKDLIMLSSAIKKRIKDYKNETNI
ncbi:MAG: hypothetical protein KAU26_05430, partial [Methylococcales bacterium]|nr:hypothetical protein [Methylococcales bacterium]